MLGYRGGGSVPGQMKNVDKEFLRPILCKWVNDRDILNKNNATPHMKTYLKIGGRNNGGGGATDGAPVEWCTIASQNMSVAAWGQLQINKRTGDPKGTLFMRHWELGVFFSPCRLSKFLSYRGDGPDEVVKQSARVKMVPVPMLETGVCEGHVSEVGKDKNATIIVPLPLPFEIPPVNYAADEVPWARDRDTEEPDGFGTVVRKGLLVSNFM